MTAKKRIIVWFRLDFRLKDNPALNNAVKDADSILPLFIYNSEDKHYIGAAQAWWLHNTLNQLEENLKKHKQKLVILAGNYKDELLKIIKNNNISAIYCNDVPTPAFINYDKKLSELLEKNDVEFKIFDNYLLHSPDLILNKSKANFKVFTPFWRTVQEKLSLPKILPIPNFEKVSSIALKNIDYKKIADLKLLPTNPDWAAQFTKFWQPGEESAHKIFTKFNHEIIEDYKKLRDFPAKIGTSQLSPHIHFGEISVNYLYQKAEKPAVTFLSQLGWREFSYNLLHYYPNLAKKDLQKTLENFIWQKNKKLLTLWKQGKTGYPIIDAGMRQLWHSGYMHNRVRMIVASFLTKDLQIDWRVGERWFFETLLDYDMANNAASWQWVAGCGADPVPYFRVFNPTLQSKKFDADGDYIRTWVPELKNIPEKYIHEPVKYADKVLEYGVTIGKDYPYPIVNHDEMRKKYLSLHKKIGGD